MELTIFTHELKINECINVEWWLSYNGIGIGNQTLTISELLQMLRIIFDAIKEVVRKSQIPIT